MNRRVVLAVTVCLLATACSDEPELRSSSVDEGPSPTAEAPAQVRTTPPAPSPSPASSDEQEPAFAANTARDEQQASGGPLGVAAIRLARQDGYDRLVFELDGREAGQPGWTVEYVDEARQDGSGNRVDVDGEAVLSVRISGAGYPMDTGVEDQPSAPPVPPGVEVVRDVVVGSLYEGVYEAFVGTSREAPFRVFRLEDPARVVVDVRHD